MSYKVLLLSLISGALTSLSDPYVELPSLANRKPLLKDPATDALNRLLKNVTFALPDIPIDQSMVKMQLSNILCGSISLTDLYISSSTGESTFIAVNLTGLDLSCTMDWVLTSPLKGSGTCDAKANPCSLNVSALISPDEFKVPASAHMGDDNCAASFTFKLDFHGDIWIDWLFNLITKFVTSSLEKQIRALVCKGQGAFPGLENVVNTNLTEILSIVSDKLDPYLNGTEGPFQPVTPPALSSDKKWVNYNRGEVIVLLDHLINAQADGSPYLNQVTKLLTNETGNLLLDNMFNITIKIPDDYITLTNITINSLDFYGLNTFNVIEILEPVPSVEYKDYPSNNSLYFEIGMDRLGFNVGGLVRLAPSKFIHNGKTLVEHVHANMSFSDIRIKMIMQVGIESGTLGKMPVGEIIEHLLPCFISLVHNTSVQVVDIEIGSSIPPQVYGFSGVAPLFNEIIDALANLFKPIALDLVHGVVGIDGLVLANQLVELIREKLHHSSNACSPYVPLPVENKWFNFQKSAFVKIASASANEILTASAETSPFDFGLDEYIDSFFVNGTLEKPGTIINVDKDLDGSVGLSHVEFKLGKLSISGMDTFDNLTLLKATGPYSIENLMDLKKLKISLFLDMVLEGSGINDGAGSYNHFWLNIDFRHMGFSGDIDLMIDKNEVAGLNTSNVIACPMLFPEQLNVTSIDLHIGVWNFTINCTECHTEELNEWQWQLLQPSSQADLNRMLQKFVTFLMSTPKGGNAPTLTYGLNEFLNQRREEASWTCGGAPPPTPPSNPVSFFDMAFLIVSFSILGLIGIGAAYFCCWKPFRQGNGLEESSTLNTLLMRADRTPTKKYDYNEAWGCHCRREDTLFIDKKVPQFMRIGIIVWLVSAIGIFIWAHNSVGASVNLEIHAAGDKLKLPALFDFSLANSIRDMFNARVYVLGLLIAVFSGAWPYLKLLMLLTCWVLPIPKLHRGRWLYWLDILGKYSLIDAFVLIILMVAFRFHLETPHTDALPDEFFIIDVYCIPGWGIFGFLIAAVQSLIATHVIIYYHKESTLHYDPNTGTVQKEALRTHFFECRDGEGIPVKVRVTCWGQIVLAFCIFCSILLLLAGATVDSFDFKYGGMAGEVLTDPHPQFSMLTLANNMLGQDMNIGNWSIWGIFILFTLIFPVVHLLVLLVMWLVPLSLGKQRDLLITVQVFQSWSSLEVFVLALFSAVLETPQFVDFIIGAKCDAINKILVLFLAEGKVDPKCFTVTTNMLQGSWILFACGLVYIIATQVIERLAERAVNTRMIAAGMNQNQVSKKQDTNYSRSDVILPTSGDVVYSCLIWSSFAKRELL